MTVLENVRIALAARSAAVRSTSGARAACSSSYNDRAMELIADVGLSEFANWNAVELPYGRKRALEIATTLALDPEMLLLDEPTAGMGHEDIDRIAQLIKRVAANRTVLMVEHNLSVVADLSDTHHRADARPRAGRRRLRHRVDQSRSARSLYGGRTCLTSRAPLLVGQGPAGLVRRVAYSARRHFRRARRRGGHAARPQRRRQDHDAEVDHGHRRAAHRLGALRGPGTDRPLSNQIARAGIAFCPEERGIFASLDVEENLLLPPVVRPGGLSLEQIFELFPNLKERLGSSQGTKLSGGEQQMLAIGRILRTGARLLLLDEPTEGLAPVIIQQIGKTIRSLKQQGFTILLVEQNFRFASTVADRYYVMEHGRIIDQFANAELDANVEKLHEYLGV